MEFVRIYDRKEIEAFLRRDVYRHLYEIGDLEDYYWGHTVWYGLVEHGEIAALFLLYLGLSIPAVLALADETSALCRLLRSAKGELPARFYLHLSPGLEEAFEGTHRLESHGRHYKMGLVDTEPVREVRCPEVVRLGEGNLADMFKLYEVSYPGHWFEAQMLQTNPYFGIFEDGRLVSIAGTHVFSVEYGIAALGNIATHPSYRNRGYGRKTTARLCQLLVREVNHIGLNVKTDNFAAVRCYENLGFEAVSTYEEFMVDRIL
jgi:ribosomal protein S18 acetylase RimI-like enzyme